MSVDTSRVTVLDYLADMTFRQSYVLGWLPFVATFFVFILSSNWLGALVPWAFIELPASELSAPTNDINVTGSLAVCVSH